MAKKNKYKTIEVVGAVASVVGLGLLAKSMYSTGSVNKGPILPDASSVDLTPSVTRNKNNVTVTTATGDTVTVPDNPQGWFDEFRKAASKYQTPVDTNAQSEYNASVPAALQIQDYASDLPGFISAYKGIIEQKYNETGIRPEVVFAMAVIESQDNSGRFGGVSQAQNGNNFFGIMADSNWIKNGGAVDSTGQFRAYDTIDDSIADYFNFLKPYNITATDTAGQAGQIAANGYAGKGNTSYAPLLSQVVDTRIKPIYTPSVNTSYAQDIDAGTDGNAAAQAYTKVSELGTGGIVGGVIAVGLLVTAIIEYRKKHKRGLHGLGSWIMENPLTTAAVVAVPVVAALAYYKGGHNDQDTTADLPVTQNNLTDQSGAKYKIIADDIYRRLNNDFYPQIFDSSGNKSMLDTLQGLNGDELKAVVKAFGTRQSNAFGLSVGEGQNIFGWLQDNLGSDDLATAKSIFAPTGLWN